METFFPASDIDFRAAAALLQKKRLTDLDIRFLMRLSFSIIFPLIKENGQFRDLRNGRYKKAEVVYEIIWKLFRTDKETGECAIQWAYRKAGAVSQNAAGIKQFLTEEIKAALNEYKRIS